MAQMNTDFSSGPLDYSSAEFKRNLNGYHLAHVYYFIAHGSHESHRFFLRTIYFFEHESHESNEICRSPTDQREVIFFIRTIGLFHPHGKIRVHPCAKNIRVIRAIRVQRKNPCPSVCQKYSWHSSYSCSKKESVSIRVPKIFVTFERFVFKEKIHVHPCAKNIRVIRAIRVQKNLCSSVPSVGE